MGAYEELVLSCNLKEDVPEQVLDVLRYICDPTEERRLAVVAPTHNFFRYSNWDQMGQVATAYLPGTNIGALELEEFSNTYEFSMRTIVKGGSSTIGSFVHWLAPYSQTEGFVGYTRCDEMPDEIDLISFADGDVFYYSTSLQKLKRYKIDERGVRSEELDI